MMLEINISVVGLPKLDALSDSDTCIVAYLENKFNKL